MPEVEFSIDSDSGEFRLHIHGVAGPACDDVARLVKELAGSPGSEDATAEYHLRATTRVRADARARSKHT